MAQRKTILVTGATGAQGGSVARHLLNGGQFQVRCLTRQPDSDKARALQARGAQIARGDLSDPLTLRAAVDGCWGVFGVTNFWEHFEKELEQGTNLIDAVADAGVGFFVFSALPYVHEITGGKLSVPHFDIKGQLQQYVQSKGVPAAFVHVAFYYDNFLSFFPPRPQGDGSFVFGFPQGDTKLAGVAVEDVGGVVAPIFERSSEFTGRTVGIVGDDLPPAEYAAILSRVLGKCVVYRHVPREQFARLGFPGAEDLAAMFEYNRTHIASREQDVRECRRLYPKMRTFEQWLVEHRGKFEDVLK